MISSLQTDTFDSNWAGLNWSPWFRLDADLTDYRKYVPKEPGLYRVRASNLSYLAYVGQTGRSLFERVRALRRGVYRDRNDPPWNDPHTAAPKLWAYRHEDGMEFEVSVVVSEQDTPVRECQEDALLYLHRVFHGQSTLINHGRTHPWWRTPTNRERGVAAKRRRIQYEQPSLPPAIGNDDYTASDWLGLKWQPVSEVEPTCLDLAGVYRIMSGDSVVYIGESGDLLVRFLHHQRNWRFENCDYSVHLMGEALSHQLYEREADLIGAYYLKSGHPPKWQYQPGAVVRGI